MALAVHARRISESKLHGAEKREEYAAGVNVFETLSRSEGGSAAGEDDVFGKRRAGLDADAQVFADSMTDRALEKKEFERLGAFEAEKIEVREAIKISCDMEHDASMC